MEDELREIELTADEKDLLNEFLAKCAEFADHAA
jgi:hypothetical protein